MTIGAEIGKEVKKNETKLYINKTQCSDNTTICRLFHLPTNFVQCDKKELSTKTWV